MLTQISWFILSFVQHIIPYCCTAAQNGSVYSLLLALAIKMQISFFCFFFVVAKKLAKMYYTQVSYQKFMRKLFPPKFVLKYSMYIIHHSMAVCTGCLNMLLLFLDVLYICISSPLLTSLLYKYSCVFSLSTLLFMCT